MALVTGARSKESAFALHLAARFSARESVCLTVEWTARLDDGCVTGAEGNRVFLTAVSESGQTAAERKLELFHGPWRGSVDPVFREFAY